MVTNDEIAAAYDDLNTRFQLPFLDDLSGKPLDLELIDRFSQLVAGANICDLGTGTGKVARLLHERGHSVIALDISPVAIEAASRLTPDVDFRVGDLADTGFPGDHFGGATSFFSIIHAERHLLPEIFSEIARIVRPDGHLLLAVYEGEGTIEKSRASGGSADMATTLLSATELDVLLNNAGFSVVESHSRGPYRYETDSQRLFILAQLTG